MRGAQRRADRRGSATGRPPAKNQAMQIRVVTLRYNEALQGFPEDVLRTVTFGREVLNVSEHFFVHGNVPHLTLVLSLGDSPKYEKADSFRPRDLNAPDPEDGMTDEQKTRYRALKTWRNETAKVEGRPAYAIARNVQLAELVKAVPKSLAAIKEVQGLGEGFCEKYGKKVLELMGEINMSSAREQANGGSDAQEHVPPDEEIPA